MNEPAGGRIGDWIQTYTGRAFWPLDPQPSDIDIEDIAHALSNTCRFSGHCVMFYSVAEHSVFVSRLVPAEHALAGLLHDAAEAYMADVSRPLKPYLPNYKALEDTIEAAVAAAFGLEHPWSPEVKRADNAMLAAEAYQLMCRPPRAWALPEPAARVDVLGLPPEAAKHLFLTRFNELTKGART